ncbi:AlpA family phage regulatory protein [Aurantimonas sp. A2-1-M11]|uniref:helix-turn-helix transcriptional regulator n=1 Tax=Aurantimonas sp. A2-1-M11 TaxID=3113712 RepID=UPI002F94C3A5
MHVDDNQAPRLISLNDVCSLTSLSRTAINKFRVSGDFPVDVRLGEKRIAFVRTDVYAWLQQRIDEANAGRRRKLPADLANDNSVQRAVVAA